MSIFQKKKLPHYLVTILENLLDKFSGILILVNCQVGIGPRINQEKQAPIFKIQKRNLDPMIIS